MRTNITLPDDAYQIASLYAEARGITLGAAIGELVLKAEEAAQPGADSPRLKKGPNGFLIIASGGADVTPEMVKDAQEDELV